MPVSITSKLYSFTNGTANDAGPVDTEVTNLHVNDANLAVYANAAALGNIKEGLTLTLRSDFTGTPATGNNGQFGIERGTEANVYLRWNEEFDRWEATNDGTNFVVFASNLATDPTSPTQGSTWYNTTSDKFKVSINGVAAEVLTTAGGGASPYKFQGSAPPVYSSASTFSLDNIACRNKDNDGDITKTTSTTVTISNNGLNGCAQSANLTGTISVSSGGTGVTGSGTTFTTDFVVGDTITTAGGQSRRITVVGSNTSMTVESTWGSSETTVTFKRGGEAKSTWYYLYAVTDGTTPGLLLSSRSVANGNTLADLPSGYTEYRQLPFAVRNDSSSNIIPFRVGAGWPYLPEVYFYDATFDGNGATQVLNGGASTSYATVNCSGFVPTISQLVQLQIVPAGSFQLNVRPTGSSNNGLDFTAGSAGFGLYITPFIGVNSSQQVDYKVASSSIDIQVIGFQVTLDM